jgi:hypothetical protein
MAAWTAEQVAELGKLVSLGWSSFEIASRLGKTDDAIRGMVWRAGLTLAPQVNGNSHTIKPKKLGNPLSLPPEDPPPQGSMTFAELPNSLTACRWPYGNPHDLDTFRYCGVGTEPGQSYCRAHQAKAWGRS